MDMDFGCYYQKELTEEDTHWFVFHVLGRAVCAAGTFSDQMFWKDVTRKEKAEVKIIL